MADNQSKLGKFWQELKRRKVVRVVIVYATTAFVLLELVSIIEESLNLPDWFDAMVIVLLAIGFPIAVIFSWVFDVTPKGIEVTQSNDKSIAVLPFKNDSTDSTNVYLINGLMESILNNLAKIEDLRVLSRTSVEKYRNNPKLITEVAKDLNVTYIVEGSGQKVGEEILLTVQLIEAPKDKHLWSEQYKKEANDIIKLQIEVANTIAKEINAIITPREKQQIESIPTENLTAWDLFLRAKSAWAESWITREMSALENVRNYLLKAIELDPKFSTAYAQLGILYYMLGHFSPTPSVDYWREALRIIKKAIELDSNNGIAYSVLGVVQSNWIWDSNAARKSFERAIELTPNEKQIYVDYLFFESRMANCKRIKFNLEKLRKMPEAEFIETEFELYNFKYLTCQGKHDMIVQIAENKKLIPLLLRDHMLISAYLQLNEFEKAMDYAELISAQTDNPIDGLSQKGIIYAVKGDYENAHKVISNLENISNSRYVSPTIFASIYTALNEEEKAVEYLNQALKERDWRIHDIFEHAPFYQRRKEPWLMEIIRKSWIPLSNEELI